MVFSVQFATLVPAQLGHRSPVRTSVFLNRVLSAFVRSFAGQTPANLLT